MKLSRWLLVPVILLATWAHAEQKIGVVDKDYVLYNSEVAQQATRQLREDFAEQEAKLELLNQQLLQIRTRLTSTELGDTERAQIESQKVQYEKAKQQLVEQLQAAQAQRRTLFLGTYEPVFAVVLQQLIEQEQLDLVFDAASVIYVDEASNYTQQVLNEFNLRVAE